MPSIIHPDSSTRQADCTPASVVAIRPVASPRPLQSVRASLSAQVATSTLDPSLKAEMACRPSDLDDPALIVGLALWTARQHERYVAAHAARGDGSVAHRFPVVLVDTLRRQADAGDPTCRLVLDWLKAKGFVETNPVHAANGEAV